MDEDETKAGGLRMVAEDVEEERMLEYEEEESEIDNGGGKEKVEPMTCVMDFECTQNVSKEFEVVHVGWKYLGEIGSYREAGTAMDLLRDAQARTVMDSKERKVYVYAHNMRGFHSSFILHALYDLGYKVVKVLSVGAKYLSFECGNLIFRDSLNFFNMALEKLPATFNLHELHQGFFTNTRGQV